MALGLPVPRVVLVERDGRSSRECAKWAVQSMDSCWQWFHRGQRPAHFWKLPEIGVASHACQQAVGDGVDVQQVTSHRQNLSCEVPEAGKERQIYANAAGNVWCEAIQNNFRPSHAPPRNESPWPSFAKRQ